MPRPHTIVVISLFIVALTHVAPVFTIGEYTYSNLTSCNGETLKPGRYKSLQEAKVACDNNIKCNCIVDTKCDKDTWKIKTGPTRSSSKSCAWNKEEYELVAENRECFGNEFPTGNSPSVSMCASSCKSISSMFIFANREEDKRCICETIATNDGSCNMANIDGFNLYKFTNFATCTDGLQNGDETGIDCGGNCDACSGEIGARCTEWSDCDSGACRFGICD